jgi:hypothetical protein
MPRRTPPLAIALATAGEMKASLTRRIQGIVTCTDPLEAVADNLAKVEGKAVPPRAHGRHVLPRRAVFAKQRADLEELSGLLSELSLSPSVLLHQTVDEH